MDEACKDMITFISVIFNDLLKRVHTKFCRVTAFKTKLKFRINLNLNLNLNSNSPADLQ